MMGIGGTLSLVNLVVVAVGGVGADVADGIGVLDGADVGMFVVDVDDALALLETHWVLGAPCRALERVRLALWFFRADR